MRRFHEVSADAYRARAYAEWRGAEVGTLSYATFAAGTVLSLLTGVWLYDSGQISIGTVFLLFQSIQLVRASLEVIADQLRTLQQAGAGATRVAELFDLRPSIVDGRATTCRRGRSRFAFERVSFSYGDGPLALDDVSFSLPAGHVLGVVGRTGSGKSTLARLMLRLYDASDGRVRVGGTDVRDLTLHRLRDAIGIVTQDVQLFEATLRDNLTLFAEHTDDARLLSVLEELDLGSWLARLPDGLDTLIGGPGVGLSAGEAQLLAFGRVFLHDPGVVILDEASSRLDPATEQRIERAVDRLLVGRTAILVAHRLATLERADDVLVLDHGRVAEHGARVDLMADSSSHYAGLVELGLRGARREALVDGLAALADPTRARGSGDAGVDRVPHDAVLRGDRAPGDLRRAVGFGAGRAQRVQPHRDPRRSRGRSLVDLLRRVGVVAARLGVDERGAAGEHALGRAVRLGTGVGTTSAVGG